MNEYQENVPKRHTQRPLADTKPLDEGSRYEDDRFKNLLGAAAWDRLPSAIKRRFSKRLTGNASLAYQGQVTEMKMNFAGRLLAFVMRAIGAPLPFDQTSVGRPAIVTVTEDAATGGQFWIRQYGRSSGFPQMVSSSKRFEGPTGLEEYIGFGIGIALLLDSTEHALLFKSHSYFVKAGQRRIPLPKWMCPGTLVIAHEELGRGRFLFSLALSHRFLGEVVRQDAVFIDAEIVGDVVS